MLYGNTKRFHVYIFPFHHAIPYIHTCINNDHHHVTWKDFKGGPAESELFTRSPTCPWGTPAHQTLSQTKANTPSLNLLTFNKIVQMNRRDCFNKEKKNWPREWEKCFFFPLKAKPSRFTFHVARHQRNWESKFPRGDDVKCTLNFACGKIYTLASNYVDKYSPIFFYKDQGGNINYPAGESGVGAFFKQTECAVEVFNTSTRLPVWDSD